MLKQTVNKNNIHLPVDVAQVSQLVVISQSIDYYNQYYDLNDLTNRRLLRHVISCDYITHEFRVIPKHSPATRKGKLH